MDKTQIELGGQVFTVAELDPWVTFPLQSRIWPIVAEVGTLLIGQIQSGGKTIEDALNMDLTQLDFGAVAVSIGRICQKLPSAELKSLMEELLAFSTVVINGKSMSLVGATGQFSVVMKGRTIDTWKLLIHSVKVNYPDFFVPRGTAKDGAPPEPKTIASSETSTT